MAAKVPKIKLADGNEIPAVGLGTWKSPPGKVKQAVEDAIDAGYRHIDCAFAYQNENEVGEGISQKIAEGVVTREDLFITSKLWNTYHKKDRVVLCCQKSLKDLGLEYLDLYLVHWPLSYQEGDVVFPKDETGQMLLGNVDLLETWEGMEECLKRGFVRSVGFSNFNSKQVDRILSIAKVKPVILQVECHPYLNQSNLIAFCKERNIVVTAYSPFGSPDRPWATGNEPSMLDDAVLVKIAEKYGKSSAQVILRYQYQRGVVVIPKSVTKERIIANIQIFDFELTSDDMKAIDKLNCNDRRVALTWAQSHPEYPFSIPF